MTRIFTTRASPTTCGDFSQCHGGLGAVLGTGLQQSSKVSQPGPGDVSAPTLSPLTGLQDTLPQVEGDGFGPTGP